jgi:hypothetical protein
LRDEGYGSIDPGVYKARDERRSHSGAPGSRDPRSQDGADGFESSDSRGGDHSGRMFGTRYDGSYGRGRNSDGRGRRQDRSQDRFNPYS